MDPTINVMRRLAGGNGWGIDLKIKEWLKTTDP